MKNKKNLLQFFNVILHICSYISKRKMTIPPTVHSHFYATKQNPLKISTPTRQSNITVLNFDTVTPSFTHSKILPNNHTISHIFSGFSSSSLSFLLSLRRWERNGACGHLKIRGREGGGRGGRATAAELAEDEEEAEAVGRAPGTPSTAVTQSDENGSDCGDDGSEGDNDDDGDGGGARGLIVHLHLSLLVLRLLLLLVDLQKFSF